MVNDSSPTQPGGIQGATTHGKEGDWQKPVKVTPNDADREAVKRYQQRYLTEGQSEATILAEEFASYRLAALRARGKEMEGPGECICPKCGLRHGGGVTDGRF